MIHGVGRDARRIAEAVAARAQAPVVQLGSTVRAA